MKLGSSVFSVTMLFSLHELKTLTQITDNLMSLHHRDDLYDSQNRSGEADLNVAKHRNGPTKIITAVSYTHLTLPTKA